MRCTKGLAVSVQCTSTGPRLSRPKAVSILAKGRKWARLHLGHDVEPGDCDHAHRLMTFAVRAINATGQRVEAWANRKDGRLVDLQQIRSRFTEDRGNRSLIELIDLAVAIIEAATWVDDLPCREFPELATRRQSQDHVAARARARRKSKQAEESRMREMRSKRLEMAIL